MAPGFTDDDLTDQTGRVFLITGANTGLGFETSKALASKGARVLLGCRSAERATGAIDQIRTVVPNADLDFVQLDQADLSSVRAAAERVAEEPRLDVLVNNAGIMIPPLEHTADGFESQFGVNHLGTFALTALLLDKLAEGESGRVVVTSSLAHKGAEMFFDDIDASDSYDARARYGQSKLSNLLFMYELDRRLRGAGSPTVAVGCHPGIAETELFRTMPSWMRLIVPLVRPIFNSAAAGAWPTLLAATGLGVQGGDFYGPSKRGETAGPATPVKSTSTARDPQMAQQLWDLSIAMTGIDPGI
jgi:NAD(P)-dependent dehydrogenase (short-subunit alcohol dehydrogenase family)